MALFLSFFGKKSAMKIMEYADRTIAVVVDLTGVERTDILSKCKTINIVDARWMVVKLLREAGYYPSEIAPIMGMTIRQVQSIITEFDARLKYSDPMLRINYAAAVNHLRSN